MRALKAIRGAVIVIMGLQIEAWQNAGIEAQVAGAGIYGNVILVVFPTFQ